MHIPFINLRAQYESIHQTVEYHIDRAFSRFQFCLGPEVKEFEDNFAATLGTKHCIATGNGTDALYLALKTLGITYGDEVITPAFSWISSSEVITQCGATPVFVDVDSLTYTIDIQAVQRKITSRAKAIVAVHLFGQSAQVGELHNICKKNGLFLIEDCAQAHLTAEGEHYAGTFGDINAFSFYPTKNLGAYGDAGCLVTHDDQLAEKARRLANHGALQKDDHLIEGLNSRMDTLQGAVLLAKLPHLKKWNERRYALAQQYTDSLKNIPQLVTPYQRRDTQHTFHLYVIRTRRRNALKEFLFQNGIQTLIHYPQALPNLPAYQHLQLKPSDFPVASALQDDVLSLPIYPELKDEEVTYICSKIRAFFKA